MKIAAVEVRMSDSKTNALGSILIEALQFCQEGQPELTCYIIAFFLLLFLLFWWK